MLFDMSSINILLTDCIEFLFIELKQITTVLSVFILSKSEFNFDCTNPSE